MTVKCGDCGGRLRGTHYIDVEYPGLTVCEKCVGLRREQDRPDSWWMGFEWRRDVPNVLPILAGVYCLCAAIICLVLLFKGAS